MACKVAGVTDNVTIVLASTRLAAVGLDSVACGLRTALHCLPTGEGQPNGVTWLCRLTGPVSRAVVGIDHSGAIARARARSVPLSRHVTSAGAQEHRQSSPSAHVVEITVVAEGPHVTIVIKTCMGNRKSPITQAGCWARPRVPPCGHIRERSRLDELAGIGVTQRRRPVVVRPAAPAVSGRAAATAWCRGPFRGRSIVFRKRR